MKMNNQIAKMIREVCLFPNSGVEWYPKPEPKKICYILTNKWAKTA